MRLKGNIIQTQTIGDFTKQLANTSKKCHKAKAEKVFQIKETKEN